MAQSSGTVHADDSRGIVHADGLYETHYGPTHVASTVPGNRKHGYFQVRQALASNDVSFPIPAIADIAVACRLSGN